MILVNQNPVGEDREDTTVAQLIDMLRQMPQDAVVNALFDGFCTIPTSCVWLTREGRVLMAGYWQNVTRHEDRPENIANTPHWETPFNPYNPED